MTDPFKLEESMSQLLVELKAFEERLSARLESATVRACMADGGNNSAPEAIIDRIAAAFPPSTISDELFFDDYPVFDEEPMVDGESVFDVEAIFDEDPVFDTEPIVDEEASDFAGTVLASILSDERDATKAMFHHIHKTSRHPASTKDFVPAKVPSTALQVPSTPFATKTLVLGHLRALATSTSVDFMANSFNDCEPCTCSMKCSSATIDTKTLPVMYSIIKEPFLDSYPTAAAPGNIAAVPMPVAFVSNDMEIDPPTKCSTKCMNGIVDAMTPVTVCTIIRDLVLDPVVAAAMPLVTDMDPNTSIINLPFTCSTKFQRYTIDDLEPAAQFMRSLRSSEELTKCLIFGHHEELVHLGINSNMMFLSPTIIANCDENMSPSVIISTFTSAPPSIMKPPYSITFLENLLRHYEVLDNTDIISEVILWLLSLNWKLWPPPLPLATKHGGAILRPLPWPSFAYWQPEYKLRCDEEHILLAIMLQFTGLASSWSDVCYMRLPVSIIWKSPWLRCTFDTIQATFLGDLFYAILCFTLLLKQPGSSYEVTIQRPLLWPSFFCHECDENSNDLLLSIHHIFSTDVSFMPKGPSSLWDTVTVKATISMELVCSVIFSLQCSWRRQLMKCWKKYLDCSKDTKERLLWQVPGESILWSCFLTITCFEWECVEPTISVHPGSLTKILIASGAYITDFNLDISYTEAVGALKLHEDSGQRCMHNSSECIFFSGLQHDVNNRNLEQLNPDRVLIIKILLHRLEGKPIFKEGRMLGIWAVGRCCTWTTRRNQAWTERHQSIIQKQALFLCYLLPRVVNSAPPDHASSLLIPHLCFSKSL